MKYVFKVVFFISFFVISLSAVSVHVLLDEKTNNDPARWVISSHNGIMLVNQEQRASKVYKKLVIDHRQQAIYINDRRCPYLQVKCRPLKGSITCDDRSYRGFLYFVLHKNMLFLVNVVDLEDYIFSVLRTESWPGWPLEVNKVFAVACRSYVLFKIAESKEQKMPYHIRNTNKHQTYQGVHKAYHLQKAVDATRCLFLAYEKKPILAMFDSCCGGIIPAGLNSIDFTKAPYLARKKKCTFCSGYKIFNWQARYSCKEFLQLLNQEVVPAIKQVQGVASVKNNAGVVREVTVKSGAYTVSIPIKKIYSLFKKIRSFSFSVTKKGSHIVFNGTGYGHHVGLCQWGARELVDRGWDYKKILNFYYPGTELMKLKDE